jgi:hypothetical protein
MTRGSDSAADKEIVADGFTYPRRCPSLLSCAPQERGLQHDHPDVVVNDGGVSGCSPFFPLSRLRSREKVVAPGHDTLME